MNTPQEIQPSKIWRSQTINKPDFSSYLNGYPQYLQFCRNCGSLDVFILQNSSNLNFHCLDCKLKWEENHLTGFD